MKRRRLAFPVLAALLGLIVGLGAVELGLRVGGVAPQSTMRMTYDPTGPFEGLTHPPFIGYRKKFEGDQVYFSCDQDECIEDMRVPFRTSSIRQRGLSMSVEKPEGVWRVLVLGDSFSVADGVLEAEAWPQVLGRALDEQKSVERVQVINTSMQAYSTLDQWHVLQYAIRFAPDIIVMGIYLNDAMPSTTNWSVRGVPRPKQSQYWTTYTKSSGPLGPWLPPLTAEERALTPDAGLDHQNFIGNVRTKQQYDQPLILMRWADAISKSRKGRKDTVAAIRSWWGPWNKLGQLEFTWSIQQLGKVRADRSIPIVAAIFPWMDGLQGDYPFHGIHSKIHSALDDAGIPYVDLLEPFQEEASRGTQLWAHPTDHHPSAQMHAVAADQMLSIVPAEG